jgi:hypothetical protein
MYGAYDQMGYQEIEVSGEAEQESGTAAEQSGVSFSILRVSRRDPKEKHLVAMLLRSEPDLNTFKEPMALPVFGRGRVLYALVGKGITEDYVFEACGFLVGPCSCQIKGLNPGTDLLIAVDWDAGLAETVVEPPELPPLTGLTAISASESTGSSPEMMATARTPDRPGAETEASPRKEVTKEDGVEPVPTDDQHGEQEVVFQERLLWILAGVGGGVFVLLAVGTFIVIRRR